MQQRKGPTERDAYVAYQAASGLANVDIGRDEPPWQALSRYRHYQ